MSLGFNYQALFEIIKKFPSCTCPASRFPYYSPITQDKLKMVESGEKFLHSLGFRQIRLRHHGEIGRI